MEAIIGHLLSTDEERQVGYNIWEPECGIKKAKGIIQISHGMCEHTGRYTEFAGYFNKLGYIVAGNDHLGHKLSVETKEDLGFITSGNGAYVLPEDVYKMTTVLKEKYPDKPVILMGHSMGSFVARAYLSDHAEELAGVIIMGTSGLKKPVGLGLFLADAVCLFKSDRCRSKLLTAMIFGSYNKHYGKNCSRFAWLSRDEEKIKGYKADEYCGFTFTASAYHDMFTLLQNINCEEWAKSVPTDLPILMVSGTDDPVGEYGKGVRRVAAMLAGAGAKNMTVKFYKDDRHEILHELDSDRVYSDIENWVEDIVAEAKKKAKEN